MNEELDISGQIAEDRVESTVSRIPDLTGDYEPVDPGQPHVPTVKELAEDCQPREKAKKFGIGALTNADLLAMILRTGVKGYPITTLCQDLMKNNENKFCNLERCTVEQLMEIKGVGELKSYQIAAMMEIVRRYNHEQIGERYKIDCSEKVHKLMKSLIGNAACEEMWAIFLNRGNRVIGKLRVSSGSAVATVFDMKKILRYALHAHAEGIILSHNHPSGTLMPSGADDQITRKLKDGCAQIEMSLLDHVIVTFDGFYSYRDHGRIF